MHLIGVNQIEVVLDAGAEVGEGPVWDHSTNELLWVDIPRHLVHWLRPDDGRLETVNAGQYVSAVAARSAGGVVLAMRDGFGLLDRRSGRVELACEVERARTDNRMNDGKCDRSGRFWAGTMALDMTPGAGALYRLGSDLRAARVLQPVSVPNGLGWSPDDRTMYFVDSLTGGIDAFDYAADSGLIAHRRRLIDIATDDGLPDGMAVDADGFLWLALWGGWSVRRYAPDGTLDMVVELPTAQITSCTFGGEHLDELYVTSAARGLAAGQRRSQPHAGAIFRVLPGVRGVPAQQFAG